jgi:hypothetical protein
VVVRPYSTIESAGLFVFQDIDAPPVEIFDDDIEVMMSRGEPPLSFRPCFPQAGPVVMAANPQIKARR